MHVRVHNEWLVQCTAIKSTHKSSSQPVSPSYLRRNVAYTCSLILVAFQESTDRRSRRYEPRVGLHSKVYLTLIYR